MKKDHFRQLLLEKESARLTDDFESNMMILIRQHALSKSKEKKYLRLMYLFFLIGLLFGFTIAITFVDLEFLIGSNKFLINKLILQIPLVVIILFLFEKIYKATMVSIGKEKFSSI